MDNAPRSGRGLDPETLAAYLDGRLPPEERARVEAELATDPESYEWLVQTMRAQLDMDATATGTAGPDVLVPVVPRGTAAASAEPSSRDKVLPFRRRGVIAGIGAVLAVAAALALVVRVQPVWWQSMFGPPVDPRFAKLVAAVGEERYIEGRLTGGFKYGPLRPVTRGPGDLSNQNLALLAAAGELQKAAQADPSVENLHAWGVAQLLLGDPDVAVETLLEAKSRETKNIRVLVDLAAAYLSRSVLADHSDDLPRALDAALAAMEADPSNPEPYYTAAIALEKLHLLDRAKRTWAEVLLLEREAGWKAEAQRRLAALETQPSAMEWRELERRLPAGLSAGDVELIATRFPNELPEKFFATLGSPPPNGDFSQVSLDLAKALAVRSGDSTFVDELNILARQPMAGRAAVQAAVFVLAQGIDAFLADRYTVAGPLFQEAQQRLKGRSLLFESWADYFAARTEFATGHASNAIEALTKLSALTAEIPPKVLSARVHWTRGIAYFSLGEWQQSRTDYLLAIEQFSLHRDPVGMAAVQMNLSILNRFFGDSSESWRERVLALGNPPSYRPSRWHGFLLPIAVSASLDGFDRVALVAADASVENADEFLGSAHRAESRQQRAKILSRLQRNQLAVEDIREAQRLAGDITDPALKSRLSLSLNTALAQVLARLDPEAAVEAAKTAAMTAAVRQDALRSAEIALYRAQAEVSLGRNDLARAAIDEGIREFERARSSLDETDPVRLSTLEPVWSLFDERVRLQLATNVVDQAPLFEAIESARARTLMESKGALPVPLATLRAQLGTKRVVLLHQGEDELLVWSISQADSEIHRLPIAEEHARELVLDVRRSVQRNVTRGNLDPALTRLVTILGNRREALLIVPDGPFWGLPWAALRDEAGRLLIEQFPIAVLPAASFAIEEPARHSKGYSPRVLVLAGPASADQRYPPLPGSLDEARGIESIYREATVKVGVDATPAILRDLSPAADVIHISAHASASRQYPLLSRILLALDSSGRSDLNVSEIVQELRLSGSLVILATCASIGESQRRGEGSIGLAWGFLRAGAGAVIGTLWEIDDRVIRDLFIEFHQGVSQGMAPAEALRIAQVAANRRGVPVSEWAGLQAIGQGFRRD